MVKFKNPLHLLRALLRECTYLPDPASRLYFRDWIMLRYRTYCPRGSSITSQEYLLGKTPQDRGHRRIQLLRRGRETLSLLRRTNIGSKKPSQKVLELTYGRCGKRRHELMETLFEPDIPQDAQAVEALAASLDEMKDKYKLGPKVRALLISQRQHKSKLKGYVKSMPSLEPEIPETNSWGRPMPQRRVKNIKKRWNADVRDKIIPPLPEEEWNRLRDLAYGTIEVPVPPPRRPSPEQQSNPEEASLLTLEFLSHSLVNNPSLKSKLKQRPHAITLRSMRRAWQEVFVLCPVLRWNRTYQRWEVEWGASKKDSASRPVASDAELELFSDAKQGKSTTESIAKNHVD
ncbi:MAG: hypothetical protein M1834_000186 [Cirrosporium novae-zelandiae]|nr:MAG: hypothetical protein M1834_000186 [Cirrosporium novae-zelandiae]